MKRRKRALLMTTVASLQRLRLTNRAGFWIRWRLRAALALGVLVLTLTVGAPVAYAATFTVTNTNDSGPGSLRQAVLDANLLPGPDTITFAVTGTITLTSGQLTVTDHLTIDGPGAANLTVSGNNASRVLEVSAGVNLNVEGLTVANGAGGVLGGGIFNNGGTLTVANSVFSANSASLGGGIASPGPLTVTNSTFSGNIASDGGGIFGGPLTVIDSTFTGNPAPDGGGLVAFGTSTVRNSTFDGNGRPPGGGGGPSGFGGDGGGILNHGTLSVVNSTFADNSADDGGGINNSSGGSVTLTHTTFSDNFAGTGGGIFNEAGTLTLQNSIVANSPAGGNCAGVIIDGGGNLQHPGLDCGATIPSADPLLLGLANNGGPTQTMALPPESPAVDTALVLWCQPTDQRGVVRPQGAGCDKGAFELEVAPCPPGDDDRDDDGLDDSREDLFGNLLNDADSDDDGIRDGNDDGDDDGEDDEDEDDGTDPCPDDKDGDGEDDEDEDDEEDDD